MVISLVMGVAVILLSSEKRKSVLFGKHLPKAHYFTKIGPENISEIQ
jgi:hypothetical protein